MLEKNSLRTLEELEQEAYEYIKTHSKADFINEVKSLSKTNPLLYMIIISTLELKELQILSEQDANDILQKVAPYEERLREDFFTARN